MKLIIKRERPFITYPFIVKRADGGQSSMPSGHAASAFNTATALSLVYPKWYVIVPAYSWACLVAYGRMYQGVHYPSDVAIGAVVGAGTAWATRFVINKYFENRKFKQPAVGYSF
jgi:undecaprenyl-diphosphatase